MSRPTADGHVALLHGYRVRSEIPLYTPAAGPCEDGDLPGIEVVRGPCRPVPWEPPPGEIIAQVEDRQRRIFYAVTRAEDQYVLRFYGACEFVAAADMSRMTVHVDPSVDPGIVPVLLTGTVVAVRLMLDGHLVLHASAVAVDGRALAFVGSSGMGKSTMATLMCAAGHPLISDDVLRCAPTCDGNPLVWPGAAETRLRKSALEIQSSFGHALGSSRMTADGRTAIGAQRLRSEPMPLAACVVPMPSRALAEPEVQRLSPMAALVSLLRFPRVLGWIDAASTAEQFDLLSDLVQQVPVYEARLPWGPPFSPSLTEHLLDRLEL